MNDKNVHKKGIAPQLIAFGLVVAIAVVAAWFTRGIWSAWLPGGIHLSGNSIAAENNMHGSMGEAEVIYTCPMHPQIVRDKPGDCPICGMKLVKKEVEPASGGHEGHIDASDMKMADRKAEPQSTIYHCPMCPGSESYEPGKCPTCGMDLVPKEPEEMEMHEGHTDMGSMKDSGDMMIKEMKTEPQSTIYFCPMCPGSESYEPGTCTTCGMDLIEKTQKTTDTHEKMDTHEGHESHKDMDGMKDSGEMMIMDTKPKPQSTIYFCPMCPGSESYEPGTCTTCGMDLIEKTQTTTDTHEKMDTHEGHEGHKDMGGMKDTEHTDEMRMETGGGEEKVVYTCPMHPQIIRDQPGNCPICGMTLVKKTVGGDEHAGHDMKKLPEGVQRVTLDPREVAIANVATEPVKFNAFSRDVNTVGRIEYNEETIETVAAWFPGRIEKIRVKYVGETVRRGQTVMSVYSPELVASQKELLLARDTMDEMSGTGYGDIESHAGEMLEAARSRLRQWGLSEKEISSIETTGKFTERVNVTSPVAGTVVALNAREGAYVKEGTELFSVADLGSVWINAEVYEYEFSKAELGAKVIVTAESYPSMTFEGRVSFISPEVDRQSRTVKVRVTLPNPGGLLKPGMFVDARILSQPRRSLTVPASAVLYTGKRDIVWVQVDKGMYESRVVELGTRSGEYYEVVSGLKEGDQVVTQGGFLIDSEAELNSSATGGMHMH